MTDKQMDACITAWGLLTHGTPASIGKPDESQVAMCMEWIASFAKPTKTIRPKSYSYWLKHAVEKWAGERGPTPWIANGAFIEAARRSGYRYKRMRPDGLNASFNMSVKP